MRRKQTDFNRLFTRMSARCLLILLLIAQANSAAIAAHPADLVDVSLYANLPLAVADAVSMGKSGVYIPAGHTTTAPNTINLPSTFRIVGADPVTSVVSFTGMINFAGFVVPPSASGVEFRNMTVDTSLIANPSPGSTAVRGVIHAPSQVNNMIVSGVTFTSPPQMAVYAVGDGNQVLNSNLTNQGFIGIRISGDNSQVRNNTIDGGEWYGISVDKNNNYVTGNQISNLGGSAGRGIQFSGATNSLIANNLIDDVYAFGIYASGGATNSNVIFNNTVTQAGFVNGVIVNEPGTGINLWPGVKNNLVIQNTVPLSRGYGITVVGNGDGQTFGNVISGNLVSESSDPGVLVSLATDTVVRKNQSNGNSSVGFLLGEDVQTPGVSDGLIAVNNTALNNEAEGFDFNRTSNGYIVGNTAIGNAGTLFGGVNPSTPAGIVFTSVETQGNTILGNTSRTEGSSSDQQIGLLLEGSTSGNTVQFNDLIGPGSVTGPQPLVDNSGQPNTINSNRITNDPSILESAPPLADAGLGSLVTAGSQAMLDATGSRLMLDDGSGINYLWQQVLGTSVTLTSLNGSTTDFIAPDVSELEILAFELTASNGNGQTFDRVYVAVVPFLFAETGDFDDDLHVDGADFLAWQRGASPNPLSASDLSVWEASFGASVAPLAAAVNAVPEPSTAALFSLTLAGLTGAWRRRRLVRQFPGQ